jgi:hypothetical protein
VSTFQNLGEVGHPVEVHGWDSQLNLGQVQSTLNYVQRYNAKKGMDKEKVLFQLESRLFRQKIGFSGPKPKRCPFSVHGTPSLTIPVQDTNLYWVRVTPPPFHQNWQERGR